MLCYYIVNIITLRIDAQVHNTIFPSDSKSKKFMSTAVSSMDLNSYKFKIDRDFNMSVAE